MPDISVIIPVYNCEKYIVRCLDSVAGQSCKDFEAIIVNDGSSDSTDELCREYIEADTRFKLITQENSGPDIARRTGVSASTGDYITFVDADDHISKNSLECMLKAAKETDCDLVCSGIIRFDKNGRTWPGSVKLERKQIIDDKKSIFEAYFTEEIIKGTYYAKLIKKDIIKDYGFVENSVIGEDISAVLYLLEQAGKVCVIPECCYYYFYNPDSISHSGYTYRHGISLDNYIALRDHILELDLVDIQIVCGYFAEYEMAVATAMSRNKSYDRSYAEKLRQDLKTHWEYIRSNKKTAVYMKLCMMIYMMSPKLFILLYRPVYLISGR